jgi:O-acetyl-ADP-ribose deacetylase (regulator of RNase III)
MEFKMKIEYRKGDLFKSPEKVFIHGCNDQGVQGSGFSVPLRKNIQKHIKIM